MTGNPDLIQQYRQVHATCHYGDSSIKNARFLRPEVVLLRPHSILDYGCGRSLLIDQFDFDCVVERIRYDPAIPAFSVKPRTPVDLLINIDVLEHIEELDLDAVMGEMRLLCRNAIIIVDTKPASTILPDGRNAHVSIRPREWWRERLSRHFPALYPVATVRRSRAGFRTWRRGAIGTIKYCGLRAVENVRYFGGRALQRTSRR